MSGPSGGAKQTRQPTLPNDTATRELGPATKGPDTNVRCLGALIEGSDPISTGLGHRGGGRLVSSFGSGTAGSGQEPSSSGNAGSGPGALRLRRCWQQCRPLRSCSWRQPPFLAHWRRLPCLLSGTATPPFLRHPGWQLFLLEVTHPLQARHQPQALRAMRGKRFVAMKVVKSAEHYTETALDEIRLLSSVRNTDPNDPNREMVVQLLDDFKISGVNGTRILDRFLLCEVLQGLDYLHSKCKIIHTDIKPENILLCVNEPYVRRLAAEATEWQKAGAPPPSGSAVSTAPQPKQIVKMSKNKKKKLKKKQKRQAELLEKRILEIEELERGKEEEEEEGGQNEGKGEHQPCVQLKEAALEDMADEFIADDNEQNEMSEHAHTPDDDCEKSPGDLNCNGHVTMDELSECSNEEIMMKKEKEEEEEDHHNANDCIPRDHCQRGNELHLKCNGMLQNAQDPTRDGNVTDLYGPLNSGRLESVSCDLQTEGQVVNDNEEMNHMQSNLEKESGEADNIKNDHIALMIELLGKIPRKLITGGKYSKEFFTKKGDLRHITKLKPWGLLEVLVEKYEWERDEAQTFADFLLPMLELIPEKRATAAECLRHPWINS
ncbi:UNVERIFIED_CONTAM: hypothetical protein FKN15_069012 [Acipenser sinensis]